MFTSFRAKLNKPPTGKYFDTGGHDVDAIIFVPITLCMEISYSRREGKNWLIIWKEVISELVSHSRYTLLMLMAIFLPFLVIVLFLVILTWLIFSWL